MFKIFDYYDKERLIDVIRTCRGDIFLPLEDGCELNLKKDAGALRILKSFGIGKEGLTLRVTDQRDLISFMWLALQAR